MYSFLRRKKEPTTHLLIIGAVHKVGCVHNLSLYASKKYITLYNLTRVYYPCLIPEAAHFLCWLDTVHCIRLTARVYLLIQKLFLLALKAGSLELGPRSFGYPAFLLLGQIFGDVCVAFLLFDILFLLGFLFAGFPVIVKHGERLVGLFEDGVELIRRDAHHSVLLFFFFFSSFFNAFFTKPRLSLTFSPLAFAINLSHDFFSSALRPFFVSLSLSRSFSFSCSLSSYYK